MSLQKHIDPDELLSTLRQNPPKHRPLGDAHSTTSHHVYCAGRYQSTTEIPKFRMPNEGSSSYSVYQLLKDELDLDGRPNLNLASFVNTFMDPYADKLMAENIGKNLADADEYPVVQAIHARCISMLGNLWNVPKGESAVGTATVGSSEAIHLGGLAMKRLWQEKRRAEGKSTERPNILMGSNAQVALEKFARYFDVEARILPVSKESHWCLDVERVKENIDENTIGVFVILGSTYTGHYEPVEGVSKVLDEFEQKTGHSIPIHIDGASGAMVAPFTDHTDGLWDFRLPRVHSISTSGHKYGLVYPGLGWQIWRNEKWLPKDLIFELHYLGGTEQTFTLNFSRPSSNVIVQYFNFLALGKDGYSAIMHNALKNARLLSRAIEATGWYTCVSDIHRKRGQWGPGSESDSDDEAKKYNPGLPVVAFRFSDEFRQQFPHVKQQSVSTLLRVKGYIIPNYTLPPDGQTIEILRVVCRESMTADLLDMLIADIVTTTQTLMHCDTSDLDVLARPQAPRIEKSIASMGRNNWLEKGKEMLERHGGSEAFDFRWLLGKDHKHGAVERAEENVKGVFSTTC